MFVCVYTYIYMASSLPNNSSKTNNTRCTARKKKVEPLNGIILYFPAHRRASVPRDIKNRS